MQTRFKICKLYLLLCLWLSTNASPILYGVQSTPSNYQQDGSSFHYVSSYSSQPSYENTEIKSHIKSSLGDEILKNTPGVTTTFRDQNGNLVTQVKKETFNSDNGQTAHAFEFQESKQLPNGYSKSFKKEFSSSSVSGSQPTTILQTPLNVEKYNSDKLTNEQQSSIFGQHLQNYQESSISGNSDYVGIKSTLKPINGPILTNVPAVTSTFRDQNGNLVTQVKKESVNNNNGQNSHVVEFEETKQLPNGYSKSFKKEYSSSSVIGSQPTTYIQTPINVNKYYNDEKLINGQSSTFGQSLQNHQAQSVYGNTDYVGIKSTLKPNNGPILTNVPAVTSTFRDQNGNLVTQVKKVSVNNDNGQNSHAVEFEETKQLPNGYSKSFKKEYSSSSVIGSQPTISIQNPVSYPSLKDTTSEIDTLIPQNINYGETGKLNGYNTFFNNQKKHLNINIPINSQIIDDKKLTDSTSLQGANKIKSFGYNTNDQTDCDDSKSTSSFSNQGFKQQTVNYPSKPIISNGQKFEKIESFSTQIQEEVGQQSVDLHDYSKPSPIGQASVNIDNLYIPKNPSENKFEKYESTYQNRYNSVEQQPVTINSSGKSKQQSSFQPTSGQQIQGLEFLTSNYGDTTHLIDLGVNNNGQQPASQQTVKHIFGKDIYPIHSSDLPNTDYQRGIDEDHLFLQGQKTVDFTVDFEKPTPTYQKHGNVNVQTSELSSSTGKLVTDQPIKSTYNSAFDKLGQLEQEILGAKSTVNINKGNFQTSYSTNHNVKSMPVQTSQHQESHFSKAINENTQYIEPESEIVSGTKDQMFSSSSFVKTSNSIARKDTIENQTSNNEQITEKPTTQSSVWKKIGDKFKGTIQNAKSKAQQFASNINDKVGFINENVTENPC